MESIRLGGPAHGIVTKIVHITLPGGGGCPGGGWVGSGGGQRSGGVQWWWGGGCARVGRVQGMGG